MSIIVSNTSLKVSMALAPVDDVSSKYPARSLYLYLTDSDGNVLRNTPIFRNDGFVLFTDLADATYGVNVDSRYYGLFESLTIDTASVDPIDGATTVTLLPRPRYPFASNATLLRGTIDDAYGNPVRNARVEIEGGAFDGVFAYTDAAGEVVIPLDPSPPESVDLRISRAGFVDETPTIGITADTTTTFGDTLANVSGASTSVLIGYVRDAAGVNVARATVEAVEWSLSVETDAYGRYHLSNDLAGASESVDLQVTHPGIDTKTVTVTAEQDTTTPTDIIVQRAADVDDVMILEVGVIDASAAVNDVLVHILERDVAAFTTAGGIARFYFGSGDVAKPEAISVFINKSGYFESIQIVNLQRGKTTQLKVRLRS